MPSLRLILPDFLPSCSFVVFRNRRSLLALSGKFEIFCRRLSLVLVVCLEPLSAFIFGVAFMGLKLGLAECLGIAMVLANVVILSIGTGQKKIGKRKAA